MSLFVCLKKKEKRVSQSTFVSVLWTFMESSTRGWNQSCAVNQQLTQKGTLRDLKSSLCKTGLAGERDINSLHRSENSIFPPCEKLKGELLSYFVWLASPNRNEKKRVFFAALWYFYKSIVGSLLLFWSQDIRPPSLMKIGLFMVNRQDDTRFFQCHSVVYINKSTIQ